jgi:tRNA(adenine34) deaminase
VTLDHQAFMARAIELAHDAGDAGDVPIGAVVVDPAGVIIGEGANRRERDRDPTAHAEIIALRAAARARDDWRLTDCTMYVTLEPCPMCAGACAMSRLGRLVIGAWNEEYGAVGSRWDLVRDPRLGHRVEVVSGIESGACAALVRDFLGGRR